MTPRRCRPDGTAGRRRGLLAAVLLAIVVPPFPAALRAQAPQGGDPGPGDPVLLGVNALLGGITAGVGQWLRGGSVERGIAAGLAGGALGYAGRRIAAADFTGAGFIGRQVNAVGTSIVANAAADRSAFSRLDLPVGPAVFRFEPARGPWPSPRVRVWDVAWLVSGLVEERLELDWRASLSAGAPVFRAPEHVMEDASGRYVGGVIVLGMDPAPETLAHERVHVLQFDAAQGYWGGPAEEWAASLLPAPVRTPDWIEWGVGAPLMSWLVVKGLSLEWDQRPWEIEADYLDGRYSGGPR